MAHGINISEQATSVKSMIAGDSALPVIFGTAPVNMLENPTLNEPVLCLSYSEAVKAFGSIKDNNDYSLLQAIEILYSLYGISKAVFVNVLDKAKHKKTQSEAAYTFTKDKVELPHVGILKETVVVKADAEPATVDVDYTLAFNEYGKLIITRVAEGSLLAEDELTVQYDYIDISMVTADDIIGGIDAETGKKKGLEVIADIFPAYAVIPTLILAPGYSHLPGVAQSMATKCKNINGVFHAVAIADIQDDTLKVYNKVPEYKNNNSIIDANLIVCFPKVTNAGSEHWLSTHLAGVIATTDSDNGGAPHISPSNQSAKIDGLINNGQVMKLGLDEANYLNENGIVTALNFIGGFKIWGNRTSAYPSNTDVKDMFIPVRRVFSWIGNTLITNFWQNVDMPINKRNIENILNNVQFWLDSLQSEEVLNGATVTFPDELNSDTELLNGKLKFKLQMAAPTPAEDIEFILEYDVSLLNI
ncbi:MAG: hypothetical protein SPF17_08450 [Candidatus Mucispirillum faecigallinarum]|nr:hypothetical protein [Candidatus Mucispirillum faecigallinarum]